MKIGSLNFDLNSCEGGVTFNANFDALDFVAKLDALIDILAGVKSKQREITGAMVRFDEAARSRRAKQDKALLGVEVKE